MSYLYSKLPETGVPLLIGTGGCWDASGQESRPVVSQIQEKLSDVSEHAGEFRRMFAYGASPR